MSLEPGALCSKQRDRSCELEEREFCSTHGVVKEFLSPQNGSAVEVTHLPQARKATCPKHKGVPCECAVNENLENGYCHSDGSVIEPLEPGDTSASRNKQKRTLQGFLAPQEQIRSHPVLTVAALIPLLLLVLALVSALAVVLSGRTKTEIPVLLACPDGWVGYRGVCYFLSKDHRSWDQAQARCSELGASLAVLKDMDMRFFSCLSGNIDHWLGLRRQDQGLQWLDGSSFNSSVPVLGNAECVFLADDGLRSGRCSNEIPYVCSRPQTHL